jgi:hypothetical protein
MSLRHLPSVVITALLFAFTQADAQTVANGHHLDNTEVGFYGFCVDIPMDYRPFTPDTTKGAPINSYAQAAWQGASLLDRNAGFTTKELIPFRTSNRGLVVAVTSCSKKFPPVKMEKEYLRSLDMFTSWIIKQSKDDFIRDVRKVRDVHVGRVGYAKNGNVTVIQVVMIPPSTLLTFYGMGSEAEKDDLMSDLDAAVITLNIGKKGPH